MNKEIEEIIIKSFFEKRIQNRVLFERFSPIKRWNALRGLHHDYDKTLQTKYMIEISKPNSDFEMIAELLIRHGAGESSYCISTKEEIDGRELPLLTALEKAVGFGSPSIVSCVHGKLAYFEAEQDYGSPPRFILKNF